MSRKLFALEEIEEGAVVELELSPEEAEVADVEAEAVAEIGEVEETTNAVEEGLEVTDQLEEVSEFVETVSEEGDTEGLDPVAAEAIAIAVRAIGARVGAMHVGKNFAAENFTSKSSRKANTTFALEGVKEFLKDLWVKIKAAVENLWAKVKAFWDKHISSLGRIKKALEAAKTKLAASSGKLDSKAYLEEAPANLEAAFGHVGEISAKSIGDVITAHIGMADNVDDINASIVSFNSAAASMKKEAGLGKTLAAAGFKGLARSKQGDRTGLVGGITFKLEVDVDETEGTVTFTTEKEQMERADKGGVSLADKSAVKGLLDKTLTIINGSIKAKDKQAKAQEAFNKAAAAFSLLIDKEAGGSEDGKALRKSLKAIYAVNTKLPGLNAQLVGLDIRLAKNVIGYAQLCMKHYK